MSISTTVMSIGPADAQELLKNRQHQRKLSKPTVARFAKEMREGRWRLTAGNPLALWEDTDGQWGQPGELYVLNGQHRLHAVIEADLTQEFYVVYEDGPDVFMTYDNGLVRTIGTMVELAIGPENSLAISVVAGMVLIYERHPKEPWLSPLITKGEIVEWIKTQDRERLNQCVRDYTALRAQVRSLGHWYSSLAYLVHTHSASPSRWLEFHEAVVHGNMLNHNDARLTLRNYVIRNQQGKGDRWQRQMNLALGIKAWNAFITNTPRQTLMFRRDELISTGMPVVL